MRRMAGVADFVDDLCAAGLNAAGVPAALAEFREGMRALCAAASRRRTRSWRRWRGQRPTSAAAAVAVAAAQTANQDLAGAQKTMVRAVRLRPQDAGLAELSRRVTAASKTTPAARPPTTQEPPKVGAVLDGWRLELLLGRGGWGQVFKAVRGGEARALKVMHPDLSRDPAFVERFKQEIGTLFSLRGNKHLVEIHSFGYAPDADVLVFPDGVHRRRVAGAIPDAQGAADGGPGARRVPGRGGGAGGGAWRGVVHRDVKPANILLRKDGTPVLVDFGLAALATGSGLTKTGQSAGYTAFFAAPEQLRGKAADARSDVYCLAASLWYALNYDKPDLREPDYFKPDHAPEGLRDLLTRALHPWPGSRPADAGEFRTLLEATAGGRGAGRPRPYGSTGR